MLNLCIMNDMKQHWEHIYATKKSNEVSWTQDVPHSSISFFEKHPIAKDAAIIDVGGGDSKFVDYLLQHGYSNISVLDISANAIEKAKHRLGSDAEKVKWIVSDVLNFEPTQQYTFWHDRAAFHFLTNKDEISTYQSLVIRAVIGTMVIGTFSTNGPFKCSGLEIKQYDANSMKQSFERLGFNNEECKEVIHTTPSGTTQNFMFCSFQKIQ